jgi:hypothetical protein
MQEQSFKPINQNWTNEDGTHAGGVSTGIGVTICWQHGGLDVAGRNGAFLLEVLDMCKQQLEYYQNSKYACEENADALTSLEECIAHLESRKNRRQSQGILGTHELDNKNHTGV